MFWYSINNDYIKYLKKYDKFVPNVEYKNKMKCFLGIILRLDGTDFFAPLRSYKKKFDNMKNDLDFFKIMNYKTGKIYGAIDLNNMIPVTSSNYTRVTFDNLEEFRIFDNQRDKKLYWKLLEKELNLIDKNIIFENAKIIYVLKNLAPENNIARRCCNFKLLKEKCEEYSKIMQTN